MPPIVSIPALKTDIVIPVHNRRETTLRCLAALRGQGIMDCAGVIVVDDGSTDGTGQAIAGQFPEVTVLTGDGNLWWTGAILRGMTCALERGAQLIFWLNDDCLPDPGTLARLANHAATSGGMAAGQAFTPSGGRYGAYRRTAKGLRPIEAGPGEILPCDTICGNCVCVARPAIDAAGLPDAQHFPQTFGDSDYGLRFTARGLPVEVLGDATCRNDDNVYVVSKSWLLGSASPGKILASFFHPRSNLYPSAWFRYSWRHWGVPGLALFAVPYLKFIAFSVIRLLVPRGWLLKWVGTRSSAWKRESFNAN